MRGGVIHRDLKPANIMIKATGQRPRAGDRRLRPGPSDDAGEVRLTKTGQVMGTLGYMAPEQIRGDPKEIGPACDIYALGVILYELLTGELPFRGYGSGGGGPGPDPGATAPVGTRPDLDPRLEAICLKAMARKVEDALSLDGRAGHGAGRVSPPLVRVHATIAGRTAAARGFSVMSPAGAGRRGGAPRLDRCLGVRHSPGQEGRQRRLRGVDADSTGRGQNARLRRELEAAQSKRPAWQRLGVVLGRV